MADPASPREAMAVLETYQRQINALARQLDFLQALHDETVRARESLTGLKDEANEEILIPVGANTFIRGKAVDRATAITGIGAGYTVEKPWDEAVKRLEAREQEIQQEMERVTQAALHLQQEASRLEEALAEAGAATES